MIKTITPLSCLFVLILLITQTIIYAQVGIGTTAPDHRLHVAGNTSSLFKLDNTTSLNTGIMSEMYFKTGERYTGAIKSIGNGPVLARLGFFTFAATNPASLIERVSIMDNGQVGIGTNTPAYLLDVNGRMRVRNGNGSAGIYFMDSANAANRAFVGLQNDNTVGFFGQNGGGWGFTMNTGTSEATFTGHLNIFSTLRCITNGSYTAEFINNAGDDYPAIHAKAYVANGKGQGIKSEGGETGIWAIANQSGSHNHRYGAECFGQNGTNNNYGVYASAWGGNTAIAVYGIASAGATNWGGYFSGSVYTTGTYQSSDRKLKSDIRPLDNALSLIKALKPSIYVYNTEAYRQMELPEGIQYGLVADEVKPVFPTMVKQAVQPAKYEFDDRRTGQLLADEVSFEAVNYTAMIPVLIAAIQDQQEMIDALQKRIDELEDLGSLGGGNKNRRN